jgi:hypothetical protein
MPARPVPASSRPARTPCAHIDLLQLHAFDAGTPIEEVLSTLDGLVRAGKVRYVGVSNFSGWRLMKSLAIAEKHAYPRYIAHQAYYSLVGRDYEWELMPLGLDQGVGERRSFQYVRCWGSTARAPQFKSQADRPPTGHRWLAPAQRSDASNCERSVSTPPG